MSDQDWITEIETKGAALCETIKNAQADGVSDALVLPALIGVFHQAGMLPEGIDFGSILGMLS